MKSKKNTWWFRLLTVFYFSLYIGLAIDFVYTAYNEAKYSVKIPIEQEEVKTDFSKYGFVVGESFKEEHKVNLNKAVGNSFIYLGILYLCMYMVQHILLYIVFGEKFLEKIKNAMDK